MSNELIKNFIDYSMSNGKYTEQGDHEKVNASYRQIIKTIKDIYATDPSFSSLETLLDHKDKSVRLWSASVLLFTDKKEKARKILEDISKTKGLVSFSGEMTLKEWENGRLKPFYELDIREIEN